MAAASPETSSRQLLVDHVGAEGPTVRRVRGTLLAASLSVVREAGLYESYLQHLPAEYSDPILYSVASSWLPVDLMLAHYHACEKIGASDEVIEQNAARVGERLGKTFMASILRLVREAGTDMSWTLLKQSDRVWDRVFSGGGCRVTSTGPKDALLEFSGLPLLQCRYYRVSHAANIRGLVGLFSKRSFVRPVRPTQASPLTLALQLSWV